MALIAAGMANALAPLNFPAEAVQEQALIDDVLANGLNQFLIPYPVKATSDYDHEIFIEIQLSGDLTNIADAVIDFGLGTDYDPLDIIKTNMLTSTIPSTYSSSKLMFLQFRTIFSMESYTSISPGRQPKPISFFANLNRGSDTTVYTVKRFVYRRIERD